MEKQIIDLIKERDRQLKIELIEEFITFGRKLNEYNHNSLQQKLTSDDFLKGALEKGIIDMEMFLKMKYLIDNPALKFEINLSE